MLEVALAVGSLCEDTSLYRIKNKCFIHYRVKKLDIYGLHLTVTAFPLLTRL